jgi:hypothetical protein
VEDLLLGLGLHHMFECDGRMDEDENFKLFRWTEVG